MSQGNPSCLRFSLEESVWFQKGQEVLELISISLDPNITIQESDQYVTIQGALELTGEYKRNEIEHSGDDDLFGAPKFIQNVEERAEGICEFTHYFPVDITIPNNRIQSIYDIDVEVESFDYVFHERSCMKLTANLTITGLYGDQQHIPANESQEDVLEPELLYRSSADTAEVEEEEVRTDFLQYSPEEEENVLFEEDNSSEEERTEITSEASPEDEMAEIFVPFEAEARKQPEPEADSLEFAARNQSELEPEPQPESEPIEIEARKQPEPEPVEIEARKQPEPEPEPIEIEAREQPELESFETEPVSKDIEEESVQPPAEYTPEISFSAQRSEEAPPTAQEIYKMTESPEEESPVPVVEAEKKAFEEDVEVESSSPDHGVKKKKSSKKKSMSLTEFFARKEEEEVAKLKVCIVQNGDTIDILAERYEIAAHQLLRVNHLEINQDIYEGQVLYIPVALAH